MRRLRGSRRGFAQVALAIVTGVLALAIFVLVLLDHIGLRGLVAPFLGILIGLDVDLFLVTVNVRNPYVLLGVFAFLAIFVTAIFEWNLFGWGSIL